MELHLGIGDGKNAKAAETLHSSSCPCVALHACMSPPSLSLSPQDHSKIAVLPASGTFCVGDINRASTQYKRYAQKDMCAHRAHTSHP